MKLHISTPCTIAIVCIISGVVDAFVPSSITTTRTAPNGRQFIAHLEDKSPVAVFGFRSRVKGIFSKKSAEKGGNDTAAEDDGDDDDDDSDLPTANADGPLAVGCKVKVVSDKPIILDYIPEHPGLDVSGRVGTLKRIRPVIVEFTEPIKFQAYFVVDQIVTV